jgi:enoyl-CoA hydratase/carnithine racemase
VADDAVLDRAVELARQVAAQPRIAARKIKEVVLAGQDQPLDVGLMLERQAFQLLFDTADQKEGMGAFLEKRPAQFNAAQTEKKS